MQVAPPSLPVSIAREHYDASSHAAVEMPADDDVPGDEVPDASAGPAPSGSGCCAATDAVPDGVVYPAVEQVVVSVISLLI